MTEPTPFKLLPGGREDLLSKLSLSEKGKILPTHSNLKLILRNDQKLFELVQHNEFSGEHIIARAPPTTDTTVPSAPGPYPRPSSEGDVIRILEFVQKFYSTGFKKSTVIDCLITEAEDRRFHPIREWLDSLTWDEVPRIDKWLVMTFGVPDDEYHQAVASKLLLAAVRRVRQPGCKFDHMVVLEGTQGIGKSRSIATLFGDERYTDQIADLLKKDAAIDLFGKWVVELSEIDHLVRSEVETVKAFLSRCTDRYRPPYGKQSMDFPRQCVFIGTTNSEEYLRDTTGNRRIWPVRCRSKDAADIEWLAENRTQLWAEASHREAAGEAIWLDRIHISDTASKMQAQRMIEDPWAEPIRGFLLDNTIVQIAHILDACLGIPKRDWNRRDQNRVADILKTEGWSKYDNPIWDAASGKSVRAWRRSGTLLDDAEQAVE